MDNPVYVTLTHDTSITAGFGTVLYVQAEVKAGIEDGSYEYPFDTIQEAIDFAEDGWVIMVRDGTYTGEGNRDIDTMGKAVVIRSEAGAETTIIDCGGTETEPHRGFIIDDGETPETVIYGLTITGGYATEDGGGIMCINASPSIIGCIMKGNTAVYAGGGIWLGGSDAVISGCTITGNNAGLAGGIYCTSSSAPVITNSILWGDTPEEVWVEDGDPIFLNSDILGGKDQIWFKTGCLEVDPMLDNNSMPTEYTPCMQMGASAGIMIIKTFGDEANELD
jgi:parallel beta-helix repeat protein